MNENNKAKERIYTPEHGFLDKSMEVMLELVPLPPVVKPIAKKLLTINTIEAALSSLSDGDSKGAMVKGSSLAGGISAGAVAAAAAAVAELPLVTSIAVVAVVGVVGSEATEEMANELLNAEYSGYTYYNGEPYQIHNGISLETKQHPAGWYKHSPAPKQGQFAFSGRLTDLIKEKELYFRREMVQDFQRTIPEVGVGDLSRLDIA